MIEVGSEKGSENLVDESCNLVETDEFHSYTMFSSIELKFLRKFSTV